MHSKGKSRAKQDASFPSAIARASNAPRAGLSVIFHRYPISGNRNAVAISGIFNGTPISASDSFTLGSGATVDGVNFGVWLSPGSVFNKVNWVISTEPFGTSVLDAFQQGLMLLPR